MKRRDGGKVIFSGGFLVVCFYIDILGVFVEVLWCIYVCFCDWMWSLNKVWEDGWLFFIVSGFLCEILFVWWRYNLKVV